MGIRKKFLVWGILLVLVVLSIMASLYAILSGLTHAGTQQQIDETAELMADELADALTEMDQLAFLLSRHDAVGLYLSQRGVHDAYAAADTVADLVGETVVGKSLAQNVVIYDRDGLYSRFRGVLGNADCAHAYRRLLDGDEAVGRLVVRTQQSRLLGYGSPVRTREGETVGHVVVLADQEAILARLLRHRRSESLHVVLLADEIPVLSDLALEGADALQQTDGEAARLLAAGSTYRSRRQVGVTPYALLVVARSDYAGSFQLYFLLAAVLTGMVLVAVLLAFWLLLRRNFLKPMVDVMEWVDRIDLNQSASDMPVVHSEAFIRLLEKLGQMRERIDARNSAVREAQLQIKNAEIRRQQAVNLSLKKQINAHFTVNVLSIIRILVGKQELERAIVLCDGLSSLVRYAHDEDEFIDAWDEFRIIGDYLDIMNIRHENRFTINYDLDDRLMGCRIPRMLLQPIVENAIVHGYRHVRQGCGLDVSARLADGRILLQVCDYGAGMRAEELAALRERLRDVDVEDDPAGGIEHVALLNIQRRAVHYYGEGFGLSIDPVEPSGTCATLVLGMKPIIHDISM